VDKVKADQGRIGKEQTGGVVPCDCSTLMDSQRPTLKAAKNRLSLALPRSHSMIPVKGSHFKAAVRVLKNCVLEYVESSPWSQKKRET
jgi:hypothetical protein